MRFKLYLLLIYFFVSSIQLQAQFQKVFNCPADATGYTSIQTADRGYFIFGAMSDGPDASALSSLWIKTDSAGEILWSKKVGVQYCLEGNAQLLAETDSGVIIGMQIQYAGDESRIFLLHIDAMGNVLWHNSLWMEYNTAFQSLSKTKNGYLISAYNDIYHKIILIKTDLNGNVLWGKNLGFNFYVTAEDAIETAGGNILACGSSSIGSLIVKLDSTGNVLSSIVYKDSLNEMPFGLLESNSGFLIYGSKKINSTNTLGNSFVTSFDNAGNIIWSKTYAEGAGSYFYNAKETSSGDFIFSGQGSYLSSYLYPCMQIVTDQNGDTLKTNYLLANLWSSTAKPEFGLNDNNIYSGYFRVSDTINQPFLSSVYFQNECNIVSTGISVYSSTGYTDTIVSSTIDTIVYLANDSVIQQTIVVTEEDLCTILNIKEPTASEFIVYPNPVSTVLNIDTEKPFPLHVFDLQGRIYQVDTNYTKNRLQIDISFLEMGVYYLQNEQTGKTFMFLKSF